MNEELLRTIETLGRQAALRQLLSDWDSLYGTLSEDDLRAAVSAFAELDGPKPNVLYDSY